MNDNEVGELWRESLDDGGRPYGTTAQEIVQNLIRKLVEERARRAAIATGNTEPFIKKALREFGIDPETFK